MGEKTKIRLKWLTVIAIVLAAAFLAFAFINRAYMKQRPLYVLESSSEAQFARDGKNIVIDNGKKTVLVLNEEGNIIRRYDGGSESEAFFYASYAAEAEDGSIYVADTIYGNRGNLIDRERIIRLDKNKSEVVYEIDYTGWETDVAPLQYGRIVELQAYGDSIYFVLDTGDEIELYKIDTDKNVSKEATISAPGVKNDASYDIKTGSVVVVDRSGEISVYNLSGGEPTKIAASGELMPYDVCARSGEVYYTELKQRTVRHFSVATPENDSVFAEFDEIPFKLDVSEDGRDVLMTDQVGFYRLSGSEGFTLGSSDYVSEAHITYFAFVVVLWVSHVLGGLCCLFLLFRLIQFIITMFSKSENAPGVALIVMVSLLITFVLVYSLMSQLMKTNTDASEKAVWLFSELIKAEIDEDALETLDDPSDYGTEKFEKMKAPLDAHTWNSYESGDYFYYIIYRIIDGNVVMVMDFEDTMPCGRPMYPDDPEDNDYSAVMHTGERILISEISAYGSWTFQLTPLYDDDGNVIGELEVGRSLDSIQRIQNELRIELIISAATATVVIAMMLLELTFLVTFLKRKSKTEELDNTERVPVRTFMFISYLADSMQDAFIAILCAQLYHGGLPFSDGVAIALPLSAQLLMMALFSLFAGHMAERLGSRKVLTAGMLIQLSGFLVCLILGSYWGLLIGKMLIGSGMGTIYVGCNTVAATGGTSEKAAAAFAGVSAGTISGLTIGAGLASILLSMGGWKLIYLIGAIIVGLGAVLAFLSPNIRTAVKKLEEGEKKTIGFPKFFFNFRVLGFFLLILVPFMMALSYREYFFPLFASENNIGEVRIGQIYLICGMLVIYVGPSLSKWLLKHLGALWSTVLASSLMCLNMLLFVLFPSLGSVIAGVVILSIVISFAYTCQYTYFEMTPQCAAFGEGRSMGTYSVFESIGQTIGPVAYGALLAFGYRQGITIFCIAMAVLTSLFAVMMIRNRKIYKREQ